MMECCYSGKETIYQFVAWSFYYSLSVPPIHVVSWNDDCQWKQESEYKTSNGSWNQNIQLHIRVELLDIYLPKIYMNFRKEWEIPVSFDVLFYHAKFF